MNILQVIEEYESRADTDGLNDARSTALDHYLGRPYGDEEDGRSQVVMRDVADTIEWIKPSLMKIFAASDEVVRFDPVGPEDEQAAQQETEYCNHLLMQKANGFIVLHDWFHDALLQKNGYVLVRPSKKTRADRERFEGLTDDEFNLLASSKEVELLEHSERTVQADTIGGPTEYKLHDCVVRQVVEYTCIDVVNIPPERVLIDAAWPHMSLRDCPFVEIIEHETISNLRSQGYDVPDDINDSAKYDEDEWTDWRRNVESLEDKSRDEMTGPSRRVKVRRIWVLHDADDDGIAERHKVVVVGNTVLEDEEDDLVPVAAITPGRVPHEHNGMSIDDWVSDLQRIRTVLVRGYLDNIYLSMHGRNAIDINRVNLDDMMVTRAGGVVRVQGDPSSAIFPIGQINNGASIIQGIEYIDTVRENRTGVTKYNQGLDANSLNKTAHGVSQIMTASQQRIELIARVFAETGVRELFLLIHAMSIKHGRQPEMVKLRGAWVPIDPRGWKTRNDVTVAVGIGTGNKVEQLQHLATILQYQTTGMQIGVAQPVNVYNALKRLTQAAGFKQAEEFWTDPARNPPQPPGPPLPLQIEQMKLQADAQKTQAQAQADQAKSQAQMQLDAQAEQQRMDHEAQMAAMRMQFEGEQKERDRQAELQKAQLQASVQFEIAQLREHMNSQLAQIKEAQAAPRAEDQMLTELRNTLMALGDAMAKPRQVVISGDILQ